MLHTLLPFGPQVHVWKPIAPTARELENESWDHGVMVRLPAGVGPDAGRHQLEAALVAMIRAQAPDARIAPVVELVPVREILRGKDPAAASSRAGRLGVAAGDGLRQPRQPPARPSREPRQRVRDANRTRRQLSPNTEPDICPHAGADGHRRGRGHRARGLWRGRAGAIRP